jgi:ATP-dependent DNA helicase RecG
MVMKLAETQNGVITKQDVVELLKVTPAQAYAVIKKLQKEGKLELLCGGKYSKYKKAD